MVPMIPIPPLRYLRLIESFLVPRHERNINHLDALNDHGSFYFKLLCECRYELLYCVVLIAADLPLIPE